MTPVNQLVDLQQKTIAAERAAIVTWLRQRIDEAQPGQRVNVHELLDAVAVGAHLYSGTLFQEAPCRQQKPNNRP